MVRRCHRARAGGGTGSMSHSLQLHRTLLYPRVVQQLLSSWPRIGLHLHALVDEAFGSRGHAGKVAAWDKKLAVSNGIRDITGGGVKGCTPGEHVV